MQKENINMNIVDGGLGDMIGYLVAADYNIRNYPHVQFHVWVPDFLLDLAKHVLPKGSLVRPFSKAKHKYNEKLPGITTAWTSFHTPMRTHPVDYGFHMLTDKHIYDISQKNYLQIRPDEIDLNRFKLPKKYVVICSAAAAKVKEMPINTFNSIVDYTLQKGYQPVFLGKRVSETGVEGLKITADPIEADYSKGIDLLDKTNLLEAAAIMSKARCVIGMDGGLIHLAGMTMAPIIAGYTFADPEHLMPIRYDFIGYNVHPIVPDENKCRFCQTNSNFVFGIDFRDCFKNKDYECQKDMTAKKFIEKMDKVLKND